MWGSVGGWCWVEKSSINIPLYTDDTLKIIVMFDKLFLT